MFDWSFGRERDLYSVSSKVSAKNAFGVEDEIMFKLIYQVDASTTTLMYFELDGTTVVNNMSSIDVPERKKLKILEQILKPRLKLLFLNMEN